MKKPVLVVMAAGMASRYGGAKQVAPVDPEGHVLLDFSVYDAHRADLRLLSICQQILVILISRRLLPAAQAYQRMPFLILGDDIQTTVLADPFTDRIRHDRQLISLIQPV